MYDEIIGLSIKTGMEHTLCAGPGDYSVWVQPRAEWGSRRNMPNRDRNERHIDIAHCPSEKESMGESFDK